MHDFNHYNNQLRAYRTWLTDCHHRQILLICGDKAFCYEATQRLFATDDTLIIANANELTMAKWPHHVHQLLGQEWPIAVYDGYSGIVPNKLSALSGTVQAGGLFVLLLPELHLLSEFMDPAAELWCSAEQHQEKSHFNIRFATLLATLPVPMISQQKGLVLPNYGTMLDCLQSPFPNLQPQQHVIESIVSFLNSNQKSPIVLCADRGRGKSSALGLVAKQLPQIDFILCAAHIDAVQSVFKHHDATNTKLPATNLRFLPPDQILETQPLCDVLLIDEAASLPISVLIDLVQRYPKCVLASTMIGYEGSGRGFTIKFMRHLAKHYPKHLQLTLDEPIRFAPNDPLEHHINTLFALNCEYQSVEDINVISFAELNADDLLNDEKLLQSVFSLLVLAHYQTSVNDLRQLLDTPNQRVYCAKYKGLIIAASLVTIEGNLSDQLSTAIAEGLRRPRGHLLPQQLSLLSCDAKWCQHQSARIVRIAVSPNLHKRGIGTRLLNYIESTLTNKVRFIGTSFGGNYELASFWQRVGYHAVKVGLKRDKVSGEHALLMIKPLHSTLEKPINALTAHFAQHLPYQLLTYFKHLDDKLVLCLWNKISKKSPIREQAPVTLPNTKQSSMELISILWLWLQENPTQLVKLSPHWSRLLIELVIKGTSPLQLPKPMDTLSKKQIEQTLNEIVQFFNTNAKL
ncbi:Predicted P-loop ATPase fused to an acetyltransferase COG1444 [Pseudoalteromonas luteoviolacea B = ATCC 29581]|nr:Predicted P-loop ATPase fused to an acetyltransferase COG1444 [Pseudoalteromonas luteoviolacea B = ATCC 29581]